MSLPDGDVAFLDEYARTHGVGSRSRVVHEALVVLQARQLAAAYEAAWDEWAADEDNLAWDGAVADGLDAPR